MTLWLAIGSLFAVNLKGGEVLYLTPHTTWNSDGARYSMYVYGSGGDKWSSMTKVEGETNLWVGTVPSGDWTNVIFCRMNPNVTTNDWQDSFWGGQTQNLVYDGRNNWFTVDSKKGAWDKPAGSWGLYATEPIITVVTSPEFPATTIEETATATLKYTVDNSEEKATITIDNDAFTAVDNNGTVTITFAPTEAKEYTATITIAVGEVKETVEISATGLAKDVVKDPEVLNLTAPEFAEIIEGNTTTAVATYELLNADEAEAKVEGEGFEITEQELGKVTIEFAPTKAGEYTGTLLILVAGETLKEVAFTANAKPAPYYAIRGDMTDWSDQKDIKLTPNDDKSEYFIKGFEIASGKKFKVVYVNEDNATTWYGTDKVQLEAGISNSGQGDGDIALTPAGKYDIYYKVKEGKIWIQKYVAPEEPKEPKINIIVADFERNTAEVGDDTDAAIVYNLENIESAEVEIEGEYVTIEQTEVEEGFMIAVFFRPEEVGEFPGKVIITAGEVTEEIEFTFIATEPEEDSEPVITIIESDFSHNEVEVGDDTEAIVVYSLENAESAEVTIEGEYLTIEEYPEEVEGEGNYIEITFKPEKAGEFPGKLTITAGEVTEEIEFTFIATEPEEPVEPKINIIVADFERNTAEVGDDTDGAIVYNLENIESAEVEIEGEYVTFEQTEVEEGFMIAVFFRPEEVGEFPGKVIITAGEVTEEIEFTFIATEPEEEPEYPKTITVKVACAWEACNIWAWYADGSGNVYTEWPGEAMTKGDDGFYAIDMTIASPVYFKVNAGAGKTESENYMTEVSESTCFNMNGLALVVNEDCEYKEPVKIEPYYGIRGINGSWEMPDDIKLTEDADKAEWYITNVEVDGTQEFKVVYVDATGAATWYGTESVELQQGVVNEGEGQGNIILAAGIYDIYFKVNEGKMWIQFSAETPTDVEDAAAELIYAVDGTIFAPAPFAIIDLSGKDVTNANGSLQGTYIVKTLNSTAKISVK